MKYLILLLATFATAQVSPPLPVSFTVTTNVHECPPRLPVAFLSWNPVTNEGPVRYRVYSSTNPFAPFSAYQFYAEVPRTNLVTRIDEEPQLFFCVSAVNSNNLESARATK